MATHGIEMVVGAAIGRAPVLARPDQRIEGSLAGCLGATSTRFLHDNMAADLAEVDGRARREAVPLSYFERNGDLPFGGNAPRHGRFEVLLILLTSNTAFRLPFQCAVARWRSAIQNAVWPITPALTRMRPAARAGSPPMPTSAVQIAPTPICEKP
jgi:hypothetical protein